MNTPLVSIVMATHNFGKYIGNAIDSCLWQTMKDWELIIVDESSTDDTHKICMKYINMDERIKYIAIKRTDDRFIGRIFDAGLRLAFMMMVPTARCAFPFVVMEVLWDGQVVVCCRDLAATEIFGDVGKDGLLNTWNCQKMDDIRERATADNFEPNTLCGKCHLYKTDKWKIIPPKEWTKAEIAFMGRR